MSIDLTAERERSLDRQTADFERRQAAAAERPTVPVSKIVPGSPPPPRKAKKNGHSLTEADEREMRKELAALLEDKPEISGMAAHKRLRPPLSYAPWMKRFYKPGKEALEPPETDASTDLQPEPRPEPRKPAIAPAEVREDRIRFAAGGNTFEARPIGGGRWAVSLAVEVPRAVMLSLMGQATALLYPDAE
jgi:hypothetical protein